MYIKGVNQTEALTYQNIGAFRIHLTQMEIVKSEPILRRVVTTLKLDERPLDYEKNYCSVLKKPIIDLLIKKEMVQLDNIEPDKRKEIMQYKAIQLLKANLETELIPNTDIFI
jgi:uncharacterized protein involved in exopolysaccharide biosynthesis